MTRTVCEWLSYNYSTGEEMKKILFALIALPVLAFADGIDVPSGEPLSLLFSLLQNFKVWAPLVTGSTVIVIVMEVLKRFAGDFKYKRVVVASLGSLYAVIQALLSGSDIFSAIGLALFTYGGAFAIYEGILNPTLNRLNVNK